MKNKITIHTDGGSRGNPGPAAIGVVIEGGSVDKPGSESSSGGKAASVNAGTSTIWKKECGEYIGETTNNEAEYRAVIFALKKLKQLIGLDECGASLVEFLLDSELVVKQLNKEYKLKDKNIQNLFIEIWNLTFDFGGVSFRHIPREENREADRIVNQVLDRESNKLKL
ncbi:MAG: ribonuclease HI family protein [Patescibacteria group bacterium]